MILCDTGPLVAAFNAADRDHSRCAEFLRENWSRLVIPSLAAPKSAAELPGLADDEHGGHFIPWEIPEQWTTDLARTFKSLLAPPPA